MLAAQATATKYMGLLESPSPRKMELMMLYAVIKGMPIKQMVRYWTVPLHRLGGGGHDRRDGPHQRQQRRRQHQGTPP